MVSGSTTAGGKNNKRKSGCKTQSPTTKVQQEINKTMNKQYLLTDHLEQD